MIEGIVGFVSIEFRGVILGVGCCAKAFSIKESHPAVLGLDFV